MLDTSYILCPKGGTIMSIGNCRAAFAIWYFSQPSHEEMKFSFQSKSLGFRGFKCRAKTTKYSVRIHSRHFQINSFKHFQVILLLELTNAHINIYIFYYGENRKSEWKRKDILHILWYFKFIGIMKNYKLTKRLCIYEVNKTMHIPDLFSRP